MSSDGARRTDLGGQFLLETCVLRTLCMTVNSDGSELKYRILDDLADRHFHFPVTRSVFSAVSDLHRDGDQVVAKSVEEILAQRSIDIPDDFHVDDLFRGELPSVATLSGWIERLQAVDQPETMVSSFGAASQQDRSTLAKTHPSVTPPTTVSPPPREEPSAIETAPPAAAEAKPLVDEPPSKKERPFAEPTEEDRLPPVEDVLTPESGQWLGFLAELTKKQGERLKTGFARLDTEWGGLGQGLFLVAGEDRELLLDFLKQLVDQIAVGCRGPCLYLSFERPKAALRLQTLSRLSGAPAVDIAKGTFGKDSTRWQDVVRAGEHAVEWLQRIYVVETSPGLAVTRIRELRKGLLDSGAGAPRLVVVDNLEKLANETDLLQSVAELKELAEAFGIVVVGAATAMNLVHERSADMAATLHVEDGQTVVQLRLSGSTVPTVLRLEHDPSTHRFVEKPAGA